MRSRKNRSRKNRKTAANSRRKPAQLKLYKPVISATTIRDINVQFVLYAIFNYTASLTMYSFSSSTSQTSPSLTQNILSAFQSSPEFTDLRDNYGFYAIDSLSICTSNNIFSSAVLASAPPIFYRVTVAQTTATPEEVARSDTSVEARITNFSSMRTSVHPLPPLLLGSGGNPVAGRMVWLPSFTSSSTGLLNLQIGYITTPDFVGASSSAVKIMSIDVIVRTRFACPLI
jgi:hypothetical protein